MAARLPVLALVVLSTLAAPPAPGQPAVPGDPLAAAQTALDAGRVEEALRRLEPVLKREPKNARALLLRSTAFCMDGDVARCKQELDRALAIDPRLRQGWLNRSALAISEQRYDDALAALGEAEQLDPEAADNGLNQGAVLLLQGRLEPAAAQFQRYLDGTPRSADALYLVASNYALAGYAALAVQHLERAVQLDERQRSRARVDPNFADLAGNPSFVRLLTTDGFTPAAGSSTAESIYQIAWQGSATPLLVAVLNALQLERTPIESRVEVTDEWALVWADVRIKLARRGEAETVLQLTAPPGRFPAAAWEERTRKLFAAIDLELLKLEKRAPAAP